MKALVSLAVVLACGALSSPASAVDNSTYHGDQLRSGWNAQETVLTPAALQAHGLKRKFAVSVDGVVFGQPLIAAGEVTPAGTHDLAIVATMKDYVYALDAESGAELEVRAANVINATGVWADQLRPGELHDEAELPRIRPSRGTHVILDRADLPLVGGAIVPAGSGRSTGRRFSSNS